MGGGKQKGGPCQQCMGTGRTPSGDACPQCSGTMAFGPIKLGVSGSNFREVVIVMLMMAAFIAALVMAAAFLF